ncbi:prophage protein NinE [Phytobacter ursingii]|nr:prophage protein NinE [Phytobacter ursingii]
MRRRSPTDLICEHLIYRVTHRKKCKPEVKPSDIPSFSYTAHLVQVKWDRMRARRKHD